MKPRDTGVEPLTPRDVVVRTYEAANRGSYRTVAKYLNPEARRTCLTLARATRTHLRTIEQLSPKLPTKQRGAFLDFVVAMEGVRRPAVEWCFANAVPPETMKGIRVTRQVITGDKAVVSYAIDWTDRKSWREREYLVRRDGSWRISGGKLP